jgi:hypothetical protein
MAVAGQHLWTGVALLIRRDRALGLREPRRATIRA